MFYVGLDLGKQSDYSALAVVEAAEQGLYLRHLERYPLRTPYPGVADRVATLVRDDRLRDGRHVPELIVDATGVGVAVTDILKERGLTYQAVSITGGDKVHYADGYYRVPKRDLVAALEVSLQTGTLKVAEGLALWPVLKGELLTFQRKINQKTAHDSYEHRRPSDHDDLVLAAALAVWRAAYQHQGLRVIR